MFLTDLQAFADYIKRIAPNDGDDGLVITKTPRGIRIKQKDPDSHYHVEIGKVTVADDGTVTVTGLPPELAPTEDTKGDKGNVVKEGEKSLIKAAAVANKDKLAQYEPMFCSNRDAALPLPDEMQDAHFKYVFRDVTGTKVLMVEARWDTDKGKRFRHASPMCDPETGKHDLVIDVDPPELPIFGLELLKDAAAVYLFEGCKTTLAARKLANARGWTEEAEQEANPFGRWFRDTHAKTMLGWIGGAKRADATDWSPLNRKGLRVVIVEDHDEPGHEGAIKVAKHLPDANVSRVQLDDRWPRRWDVADPIPPELEKADIWNYFIPCGGWLTKEFIGDDGKPYYRLTEQAKGEIAYITEIDRFVFKSMPSIKLPARQLDRKCYGFCHSGVNISDYVLRNVSNKYDTLCYRPHKYRQFHIIEDQVDKFNCYIPPNVKPVTVGNVKPWLDFMEWLIPDENDRNFTLKWIATLLSRHQTRMSYGVLFSGPPGIGKTALSEQIIRPLVGHWNVSEPTQSDLEGSFNSWLVNKRLIICDELYSDNTYKLSQKLKPLMTNKTVHINEKMIADYDIDNYAQFIVISNSSRPLKFDKTDRRWLIPRMRKDIMTDEQKSTFFGWLKEKDSLGLILNWADTYNDYVKEGEHAPSTEKKSEMLDDLRNQEEELLDMILGGVETVSKSSSQPIVITDKQVQEWLEFQCRPARTYLTSTDIRERARGSGLIDLADVLETNEKRVSIAGKNHYAMATKNVGKKWKNYSSFLKSPSEIINAAKSDYDEKI